MLFHGVYILNKDPFIVALWGDDAWNTVINLDPKPDIFIWHNAWFQGTIPRMAKLKYRFFQLKNMGINPLQMANSSLENKYRRYFGIPGFHCSSYVYTNESEYPILDEAKRYEAVYAAQLKDFKRIALAKDIEKLFILTYKSGQKTWNLHQEYPEVSHADYNSSWVDANAKNKLFSSAEVGLCLSAEEGPMLASLEYMLNGLPVVSTPSRGGRDEYYSSDFCIIAEENAQSVKKATQALSSQNIRPEEIRNQTIAKIEKDRTRYINFICDYVGKHYKVQLDPTVMKDKLFLKPTDNFYNLQQYEEVLKS